MLKMENAQINRGEKWNEVLSKLKFQREKNIGKPEKDILWMEAQKSIMEDIEAYNNSKKPKGKK